MKKGFPMCKCGHTYWEHEGFTKDRFCNKCDCKKFERDNSKGREGTR